jgi:hypothetical protein
MMGTPEHFDQYDGDETLMLDGPWAEFIGGAPVPLLSNTRARTGSWSLLFPDTGPSSHIPGVRKVCRASLATQGLAFALWLDELPADNNAIGVQFRDFANAAQVTIFIQSAGAVSAYRGEANGTLLGNSAVGVLVPDAWNHIEMKVTIHDTNGAVEVRINEVTRLNITGVDTKNTSLTEISQFVIGDLNGDAVMGADWYVDDLVPWDTDATDPNNTVVDWIGDCKVGPAFPISDTAQADWSKSTGVSGYPLISELPVNDADYIFTATDGDKSDFNLTPLPGNVAEIIGYCALPRLLKTDAGTVLVAAKFKVGTDISPNAETAATTIETYWPFVSTVDPSTGAPYSNTTIPQLRLERVVP